MRNRLRGWNPAWSEPRCEALPFSGLRRPAWFPEGFEEEVHRQAHGAIREAAEVLRKPVADGHQRASGHLPWWQAVRGQCPRRPHAPSTPLGGARLNRSIPAPVFGRGGHPARRKVEGRAPIEWSLSSVPRVVLLPRDGHPGWSAIPPPSSVDDARAGGELHPEEYDRGGGFCDGPLFHARRRVRGVRPRLLVSGYPSRGCVGSVPVAVDSFHRLRFPTGRILHVPIPAGLIS